MPGEASAQTLSIAGISETVFRKFVAEKSEMMFSIFEKELSLHCCCLIIFNSIISLLRECAVCYSLFLDTAHNKAIYALNKDIMRNTKMKRKR